MFGGKSTLLKNKITLVLIFQAVSTTEKSLAAIWVIVSDSKFYFLALS